MLTLVNVEIYNNEQKGGISIISTVRGSSLSNINTVSIMRKEGQTAIWNPIYEFEVSSITDLDFSLLDILTVCGTQYSYSIDLKNNDSIVESQIFNPVVCDFNGMFIGNFSEYYVAQLSNETNVKRNTQVAYVTTLAGRTPYRVSNAQTNYSTGNSKGLFFNVRNNELINDEYATHATRILDFLTDGNDKLLKTNDGQMWWVSIDEAVSLPFNNYYRGYYPISFSWTEIGDIPIAGMVVDNG